MDYKQAIEFLESFIDYERKPQTALMHPFRLDRVKKLLGLLGSPQEKFKTIHIAGTNGKGSTAAMCASIFFEAGIKTGLYTSPHLETFRERIKINGEMINEEETAALAEMLKGTVPQLGRESGPPSFFEIYTALSFLHFERSEVELAVIEAGLGGRLDATNVITPEVSILTPIGLDHRRELGGTIEKIAGEKCGIIKPNIPVITSCADETALKVIRGTALLRGSPLAEVRFVEKGKPEIPRGENHFLVEKDASRPAENFFTLHAGKGKKIKIPSPLPGRGQALNAAAAAAAALMLGVGEQHIIKGLANTVVPGRLQFIPGDPPLLLDGGHNPPAAQNLAEIISTIYGEYSVTLIFGTSKDKDYRGTASEIFPVADSIILTKSGNPRAAEPEILRRKLNFRGQLETAGCLREALEKAVAERNARSLVCITGSFFLVGEALSLLGEKPGIPKARTGRRI